MTAEAVAARPQLAPPVVRRRIRHVVHTTTDTVSVRFDDIGATWVLDRAGHVVETSGPPVDAVEVETYEDLEDRDAAAGAAAAAARREAVRAAATRRGLSQNTISYLLEALG